MSRAGMSYQVAWKLHRQRPRASGEFSITPARHRGNVDWLGGGYHFYSTTDLLDFADTVHGSRRITELKDNWDGEESIGYSEETWSRAARFAMNQAYVCFSLFGSALSKPKIGPADAGSIDLYWANDKGKLLINIPADVHAPITFYGHEVNGGSLTGVIPDEEPRADLAAWLVKTQ